MSTVTSIVGSVWEMNRNEALTPENVISLVMVEKWNERGDQFLQYEDLTNDELLLIDMWIHLNHRDYKKSADLLTDMVETFLGITVGAAGILIADYVRK